MNIQLNHDEVINQQQTFPIAVICDNLTIAENVGMVFRLAEAMGVSRVCLCGATPDSNHKKVARVARSTVGNVDSTLFEQTIDCINNLRKEGYQIFCLEITSISKPIQKVDFKTANKIAVVIGAESRGVQETVLTAVDEHVHIPMYGKNSSMNVVLSLSMALYEIVNQLKGG